MMYDNIIQSICLRFLVVDHARLFEDLEKPFTMNLIKQVCTVEVYLTLKNIGI